LSLYYTYLGKLYLGITCTEKHIFLSFLDKALILKQPTKNHEVTPTEKKPYFMQYWNKIRRLVKFRIFLAKFLKNVRFPGVIF